MLTEKEKKTLRHYEDDLAMPKWKYVLLYGLTFSVLMTGLTFLTDSVFDNKPFGKPGWRLLIMIPVATILYGTIMHRITKTYYRKLKRKELLP